MAEEKGTELALKITHLAANNELAWRILTQMTNVDYGVEYIDLLEKFDIRGPLIEILWSDFAECDMHNFIEAIEMLNCQILYKDDISVKLEAKTKSL